ncbi:unnamed protein product [Zymoseptoria tritici ST99CH_1A5]|uniref:Protein kinase domain-containing protein n=1 Tax=Zymoseptoria tritici ST99CH_1A5 TaxID=1276529 RepID=A0A1Y6LRH1_ZYMTR|nr:unnamed protein product [Zymoseptoria tritici ST99CH_1A5]
MDYETADGSQFSLREEWSDDAESPQFLGTLITAFVDGNAYVGKSTHGLDDLDEQDVFDLLEPVPSDNIFPIFSDDLTQAPPFDTDEHYLKAPQFTYEDRQPGRTFVADRMRNEATTLELLSEKPHPSLAKYYGCVVKDGRVTHLSLARYHCNLVQHVQVGLSEEDCDRILEQLRSGLEYLHGLGIAHNDINPENVCIDASGHAVIIDFDSAAPFGEALVKGRSTRQISDPENDFEGLQLIRDFLSSSTRDPVGEDFDGRGTVDDSM